MGGAQASVNSGYSFATLQFEQPGGAAQSNANLHGVNVDRSNVDSKSLMSDRVGGAKHLVSNETASASLLKKEHQILSTGATAQSNTSRTPNQIATSTEHGKLNRYRERRAASPTDYK